MACNCLTGKAVMIGDDCGCIPTGDTETPIPNIPIDSGGGITLVLPTDNFPMRACKDGSIGHSCKEDIASTALPEFGLSSFYQEHKKEIQIGAAMIGLYLLLGTGKTAKRNSRIF